MEIDELKDHMESLMGRKLTTDEIIIMGVGYVQGLSMGQKETEDNRKRTFLL